MPPGTGDGLRCAVVRVRRAPRPPPAAAYADLRVAVAGGVDSGKSTLVGVLCHGAGGAPALDSGRGSARTPVLRHKHEVASGHTSSISVQQCAYDRQGGPAVQGMAVRPVRNCKAGAAAGARRPRRLPSTPRLACSQPHHASTR